MGPNGDRSEIAFFDVETTVPTRPGQGFAIIEFGSILVCPRKLEELESYTTLVRPSDLSLISSLSVRCNGITRDAVVSASSFLDIADRVYDILHGRIWAGHNIIRFDCARIREAFANIGRPPPEPKGIIDSLALLTEKFGRRAGDMKMATLATYFGLGKQTHRSLDDVRMNLEVLKYCATVLFLESSLPDIFTANSWVSPNAITRHRSNGRSCPEALNTNMNTSSTNLKSQNGIASSSTNQIREEKHQITSLMTDITGVAIDVVGSSSMSHTNAFDLTTLKHGITAEFHQPDVPVEDKTISGVSSSSAVSEGCSSSTVILEPDKVIIQSLTASLVRLYRECQKIKLLHKDIPFQLCCYHLKIRFGISTRFPGMNFVVYAPPSLCRVLDACDGIAKKLYLDSGGNCDWRTVVTRKGVFNIPSVRLHIQSAVGQQNVTEIYQKESSGCEQRLVFSKFDASELAPLFEPGTIVDAFFSFDSYDFGGGAGLRLVANKLIIHSE